MDLFNEILDELSNYCFDTDKDGEVILRKLTNDEKKQMNENDATTEDRKDTTCDSVKCDTNNNDYAGITEVIPGIFYDENDKSYTVYETVAGTRTNYPIFMTFEHKDKERPNLVHPGLTDFDLIWVLLHRNRNNQEVVRRLTQVLESL